MAYIRKTPTAGPLTRSDIAADIINNTHIGDTAISGFDALATAPADTDDLLISDAGTLKRIDASLDGGGGITVADQFRLTSNKTGNSDITANLERIDTAGQGGMTDNQMSESSGIFTFPLTGIYLVSFDAWGTAPDESGGDTQILYLKATTNNSSYSIVAETTVGDGDNRQVTASNSSLIDVTDTSNVKVKFTADSMASGTFWSGNTTENHTSFTFIRLGDT